MAPKLWMCGTAGALALGAMIGAAQSAPLGSAVDRFGTTESILERVQYRLCVTDGGSRQCRSVEIYGPGQLGYQAQGPAHRAPGPAYSYQAPGPVYGYQAPGAVYGYEPAGPVYGYRRDYVEGYTDTYVNPDAYFAGSPPWWQSIDKLGRGGQGY